jgi:hypothetical protein
MQIANVSGETESMEKRSGSRALTLGAVRGQGETFVPVVAFNVIGSIVVGERTRACRVRLPDGRTLELAPGQEVAIDPPLLIPHVVPLPRLSILEVPASESPQEGQPESEAPSKEAEAGEEPALRFSLPERCRRSAFCGLW